MDSAALPVFVMVVACTVEVVLTRWVPKLLKAVGENDSAGAVPVPPRLKDGAVPGRLLFSVNVPVTVPAAVGVKVTLTEQLALIARLVPQLFVWPKPAVTVKLVIESAAVPLLVMFMVCGAEIVLTN